MITNMTDGHNFYLKGLSIRLADELGYLGIKIDRCKLSATKAGQRVNAAKQMMVALKALGAFQYGVHPALSIRLFKSLMQSRWEYTSHLVPWNSSNVRFNCTASMVLSYARATGAGLATITLLGSSCLRGGG